MAEQYISPRLLGDPQAQLDTLTEVSRFVAQWPADRMLAAVQAYDQATEGGEKPMPTKMLRAVVVPPVAHDEHPKNLVRAIQAYAGQDISSATWALNPFINQPLPDDSPKREQTQAVLRQAAAAHDLPLYDAARVYDNPPTMGQIRANAFDVPLLHIASRGIKQRVLGVSHDIDTTPDMSPPYIRRFCEAAEANPAAVFVTCEMRWDLPGGPDSSMSKVIRYFSFMDKLLRTTTPLRSVSEANMGVDLATYAALGGFDHTKDANQIAHLRKAFVGVGVGEGRDMSERRQVLAAATIFLSDVSLCTSSRRLQLAFERGLGPHEIWDKEGVPCAVVGDAVDRARDPDSFPTHLDEDQQRHLIDGIDAFYGQHIRPFSGSEDFEAARLQARADIRLPL